MTHKPRISIVMVDGSFRESFHAIRYFGEQTLAADEYELLWVEFYGQVDPALQAEIDRYPNFRVITLGHSPQTPYHSSYCFNQGIVEARAELIAIPDADVVVRPDFLARIIAEHATNDKLVMYVHRRNERPDDHREDWDLAHLERVCRLTSAANHGGCLTVRKHWLLAINGYEQHPVFATHFHSNDMDIYWRLTTLGLHIMWHPTLEMYHPWHPFTSNMLPTYEIHGRIGRQRVLARNPLAFQGIDPARNQPVPPEVEALADELAAAMAEIERRKQPPLKRLRRRIKRGLRPLKPLVQPVLGRLRGDGR